MPERDTYTTYSVGCAVAWSVILILARRRLDAQTRHELQMVCGGWWMGWTSATIARIGYPPPAPLTPAGEKRLRIMSSVLVALGLANTIRMFATRKRPPNSAPDACVGGLRRHANVGALLAERKTAEPAHSSCGS